MRTPSFCIVKKLCQKNAEAAKKLMHPHTTGRKSHPRLKKEMEDKNKGSVSRIDLWDEAHKKRNGDYVNDNVQRLMEKAYDELANRRMKNGSLSSKDHDDVFENVIRKELKVNEYYDDQYWSKESDSRARSEREKRYERELQIYKFRFDNLCAFIEGKYPGEDWRSSTLPAGYTMISDGDRIGANLDEHATSTRFNITIPSPTEYVEIHDDSNMNGERNSVDDYESNESNVARKARAKKFIKATKDCSRAPSKSDKKAMKTRNGVTKQDKAQQMKKVILYLKNSTNDKEAVAIGNLISRDRTYVVGGSMLGDEYYCVVVHRLTDAAEDQILP